MVTTGEAGAPVIVTPVIVITEYVIITTPLPPWAPVVKVGESPASAYPEPPPPPAPAPPAGPLATAPPPASAVVPAAPASSSCGANVPATSGLGPPGAALTG